MDSDIINLEALLYALTQQPNSLRPELQTSLTEIGKVLQTDLSKENADRLRQVIGADEHFENAYQQSLVEIDRRYTSQERTKAIAGIFPTTRELGDIDFNTFSTSNDSVNVAKQSIYRQRTQPKRSEFLLRGDRIVTLSGGGAFLGALIFQTISGAVIGGLLAGIYAWWSFSTTKPDENN